MRMATISRLITAIVMIFAVVVLSFPAGPHVVEASSDTHTYNFSTGAGTDKWAWEKGSKHTGPTDTGSGAASADDYNNIKALDLLNRWVTELASNDGDYDSQMYKFTIDEHPGSITEIEVNWVGKGESQTGYDTTLSIWNYTDNKWELLETKDAMSIEGLLTGTVTDAEDYISGGELTVRAVAENEANGCPFLYGWNGETYEFIDLSFNAAFLKRYEDTTYDSTDCLESKDGYYDLMLHGALPETAYVNNLALWVVDHPLGTKIITDSTGTVHTISNPQSVVAVDKAGNDVSSILAEQDLEYWKSDLSGEDFNDEANLVDWVTLTLPDGPETGIAKLVVDMRGTPLAELKAWYLLHYLLGTPNLNYLLDRVENDEAFAQAVDMLFSRTATVRVQYWNGSAWVDYALIPDFTTFFNRPQVIPIDLTEIDGNQIRLLIPTGMHEFDYVAVDYSPDAAVNTTKLAPDEATEYFLGGTTADVLSEVTSADDSYAIMEQGDYINYRFAALAPPPSTVQRSFVLPAGGYYNITGPEVPEDKMENLPLLEDFIYTPYQFSKFIIPRYTYPEGYPYTEYFHVSVIYPPFEADSCSLITDYVEVKITYLTESICDDAFDNDHDDLTDCDDPDCIVDIDGDGYNALPCGPDCDDNNPFINPGAIEVCNGIDDDCDSLVDAADSSFVPLKNQVAMVLDGSGSISQSHFNIIREALADAVNDDLTNTGCIARDGSLELTVVQFGDSRAKLEVGPVSITPQNAAFVANQIRDINKMGGYTPLACGIYLAADIMAGDPNGHLVDTQWEGKASVCFAPEAKQVINIFTDGVPNRCCPPRCFPNKYYWAWNCIEGLAGCPDEGCPEARESAEAARDYAISLLGMDSDPSDSIYAEAATNAMECLQWMSDDIVWPQPGDIVDPPPPFPEDVGWVCHINPDDFPTEEELTTIFCGKFDVIQAPPGKITVEKQTNPEGGAGTEFEFTGDVAGKIRDNEQIIASNLRPGDYVIIEDVPPDWELMNIQCNGNFTYTTDGLTVHLAAGDDVTCIFYDMYVPPEPPPSPPSPGGSIGITVMPMDKAGLLLPWLGLIGLLMLTTGVVVFTRQRIKR